MNPTEVLSFTDGLGIDGEVVTLHEAPPHETSPRDRVRVEATGQPAQRTTRSVLISGGSRGIGAAIATTFTSTGHRVANLSRSGGGTVEGCLDVACDVTEAESVKLAVKQAVAEHGPVEVLVANAGITDDKLLLRMDEASFSHVLDTNLTSAFRLVKAVSGPMLRNRWGRIILISSVVATSGSAGQANYAASKAGLIGFARSLAREFGPRGVTVNVIAPGFIDTEMTADLTDDRRSSVLESIHLNRTGTPNDVAAAVEFLTSDAGAYITGAVIPVDGGLGMGH